MLGDTESLDKKSNYQRLWLKKHHLPRGENCTITYNVPGLLPAENQVMENVHMQLRDQAKPHSYITSPTALSFFVLENNPFSVYGTEFCRQPAYGCASVY